VKYAGKETARIRFPLGGIGTGCVSLAGNGGLVDWEIFNRPNRGGFNGFTHFAVRAEENGKVIDARVLQSDLPPPYDLAFYGTPRETLAGLPHFQKSVFRGEFPLARIDFSDPNFPGKAAMTAFNPFIPHQDRDSSLPAAFFEIEVRNTTQQRLDYTVAGVLANPVLGAQHHQLYKEDGGTFLQLSGGRPGDLTLATDAEEVSWQQYLFQGGWFDILEVYWRDVCRGGLFQDRTYPLGQAEGLPPIAGLVRVQHGLLAAHFSLAPGEKKTVRFLVAWNFPEFEKYWQDEGEESHSRGESRGNRPRWKNYYATQWEDSRATAAYGLGHWKPLSDATRRFHQRLFSSTLPPEVLDAVSANLSILKTPTVLRLTDGTFWAWEGCTDTDGCCSGTCTHVWNYGQALPFLFPALERSIREADYRHNQQPDGGMPFRLPLPLGTPHPGGRSCADGQFGSILAVYRDWKLSGDTAWLLSLWPAIKRALSFAWVPTNQDQWDPERSGVLWGRQHHTLDMEMFGPNSWLTGFYLAALKASAEMADHLGEKGEAKEYRKVMQRGCDWMEKNLFNGEYYSQSIDLTNRRLVDRFGAGETYWNTEHGEIKYQIGEGCSIDQVLGQWHADLYGLGEIFRSDRVRQALQAIYRHNFRRNLRGIYNPCRLYAVNDDGGTMICTWPADRRKPAIPLTYAQETMHGFEYAAASHMVRRGLVKEGTELVRSVRARYDGEKRNPWCEIECGYNYGRSTASYALLLAWSGFSFDMVNGKMGFDPAKQGSGSQQFFWSTGTAWGGVSLKADKVLVAVDSGHLHLAQIDLPHLKQFPHLRVSLRGRKVAVERRQSGIFFSEKIELVAGDKLTIAVSISPSRVDKKQYRLGRRTSGGGRTRNGDHSPLAQRQPLHL
jgi:non-lysosomal glucosylceramidase